MVLNLHNFYMAIYPNPGLEWWGVLRKTTLYGGAQVNPGRGGGFREKGGDYVFYCDNYTKYIPRNVLLKFFFT